MAGLQADENASEDFENKKNRLILGSRSWSLELSKQKHRIAAQLVSICVLFLFLICNLTDTKT